MKARPPFFGPFGDTLRVESKADLCAQFAQIDCTVSLRTKGRTSGQRERYCLRMYLFGLAEQGAIGFPLTIDKHETPDFLIDHQTGSIITLEVTEATTTDYQRFEAGREGMSLPDQIRAPLDRRPGGWSGDECVWEVAEAIVTAVLHKTERLNSVGYGLGGRNELLVYENTGVPLVGEQEPQSVLIETCQTLGAVIAQYRRTHDAVSVIIEPCLYYDLLNAAQHQPARWTWREEKSEDAAA